MRSEYRNWLSAQEYAENTQVAQIHRVLKVEQCYGDLESLYLAGSYDDLIAELNYSTNDERMGKANPSKIKFEGNIRNNLQSYKNAIVRYRGFLEQYCRAGSAGTQNITSVSPIIEESVLEGRRLSLERDMQAALRRNIELLEPGLVIVDDGAERAVASGFVDILCRDKLGILVVVELKAGKTDARVVGQLLGYMGDLVDEDKAEAIRGVIVAHEFDRRTISASKAIPNLSLMRYTVKFSFEPETGN
ncbi:endonuclease NucS domain-containing protein [Ensifer soli]|uniref:endonuclease NucS domain-containing protein n=1 Tax=Ciceribacter sp. sgz301302 TaxID=3342379 RepID=UPI0035BA3A76